MIPSSFQLHESLDKRFTDSTGRSRSGGSGSEDANARGEFHRQVVKPDHGDGTVIESLPTYYVRKMMREEYREGV